MNSRAQPPSLPPTRYDRTNFVSESIPTQVQTSPHPSAFFSALTFFAFAPTKHQIAQGQKAIFSWLSVMCNSNLPRVQDWHIGTYEVRAIPGNDRKLVLNCGCGQESVDDGKSSAFSLGCCMKYSPSVG